MIPDFESYSLALIKDGKIIHSAVGPGIKPLAQCVLGLMGLETGCILHDKVIGLAAARLTVWSGLADEIIAGMMSEPAKDYLDSIGFEYTAMTIVPMILNRDQIGICPMEEIAQSCPTDEEMWEKIRLRLNL
jgi:hypothetical protein